MDIASTLKSEIVRPFVTLVIPGATALTPYLVHARRMVPGLADYLEAHRTIAVLAVIAAVLAAGLVLDSLGSLWESHVLDRQLLKRYPHLMTDWYDYLRLAFDKEPVGQRYLRTVTLHLKFEVTMMPALVLAAAGLNWLNRELGMFTAGGIWLVTVLMLIGAIYFGWQSFNSAEVLAKTRYALLTPRGTNVIQRFSTGTVAP